MILNVEHRDRASQKSFSQVLAAFHAATGSVEDGYTNVVNGLDTRTQFEHAFADRTGSSFFMRFMVIDHGDWLSRFYDRPAKAVMIVLGNPLVAITMLQHDIRAGLNVPVRIYIYEDTGGGTRIAYDVPSTLMGDLSGAAKQAASGLDAKLAALVDDIAAPALA